MQSSSAVSVILIGLIEAGAISLKPAIGIMIGANIGTTVTGQIPYFSYSQLLSPSYCPGSGHSTHRYIWQEKNPFYIGNSILFFGIVFAGLILMTVFFESPEKDSLLKGSYNIPQKNIYLGYIDRDHYYSHYSEQ